MTLERGTLLNNRYRIVEILGQGGMGSVYRAVDENLGVEVALKENLFTTEEYARQFRREAVILATLRHPNLTRVTDHFVIEGQGQYLVMDYIEGEDLRQRMDRLGVLSEDEVITIGAAVCDALNYLHTRIPPVVHRDIKPGNIKITPQGQIFLVDFGLAKIIQGGQATTTGARAMTPGYSPPEQYGTARTDHRSDLFSLGATLYAALTGVIPEDALARAMDQVELTPIRKHNPKVSKRLAAVIEKSLAVRPDDRYQDAEAFKQALLSVKGITVRRKNGDYLISPPPEGGAAPPYTIEQEASAAEAHAPLPRNRSPQPIPISSPIEEPPSRSRRKKRYRIAWAPIILFALLLFITGVGAYAINPSWPNALLAFLPPFRSNPPLTLQASPTFTLASVASSPLAAGLGEATSTPSPTASPSPSATPTLTPRPTRTPLPPSPTLTPTPVPTTIGGGSGQIAFASDRSGSTQIWLMKVDGSGEAFQITNMPEGACQPAWSPDGLRLVFISPCSKNQEFYPGSSLFIINADGSGLMPLPNVPGGDFDPAWSPDGNFIAFTSLRNTGRPRIYLLDLRDNSVKRLSKQYSYDRQPAWSPDGAKIAFVTSQKGPIQIWIMDADGENQQLFSRSANYINTHPVWSLDGEIILFTQLRPEGGIPGLAAVSYKDGEYSEYRYNLAPWPAREARYSPDGLWIAFESWPEGQNHDIYIMAAGGAARTRLTTWERLDFDVAWRPTVRP